MTSQRDIIAGPPNPVLPFSALVGFEGLLFVSGTIGRDPASGSIAAGDIAAQTSQALANIASNLSRAGATLDNALKVTVFLTDMGRFKEMNQAYRECFQGGLPVRSCVGVSALPDPEALVEIELIAYR
jgi:2-iminobutanoate/2-iminopropanoate deaminase